VFRGRGWSAVVQRERRWLGEPGHLLLERAGGEVFDSFPASGTLEPGFYEIVVRVVAEANLVRAGSGTAEASFTLTVGTAP
jgi:hypothetical protein